MMRWLLRNLQHRLEFALRNPHYAVRSLYRELISADERFLASITGVSAHKVRAFLDEATRCELLTDCLREAEGIFRVLRIESADLYAKKVLVQYAAIRAFEPDVIVETGVANGVSSAYLLSALHANNRGTLYSIGLDDPEYLPAGKSLGWIVPEGLRYRWKLMVGDARDLLPKLISDVASIDVFIHDSLHTYEHMLWEYRSVYPHLREGGLLVSDDAMWNSAFREFAHQMCAKHAQIIRGVGFFKKNIGKSPVLEKVQKH
jgi:predicted O-methyltransferase YrrM